MGTSVTLRLDAETERILGELAPRGRGAKSRVIREALRTHWQVVQEAAAPNSWQVYASLGIPRNGRHRHDRARRARQLVKEKLLAKHRSGTL